MDIVIYTSPETLLHKQEPGLYCWWSMSRPPRDFNEGDKIWFATRQEIKGYFICSVFSPDAFEQTIEFDSDSWVWLPTDIIREWRYPKPFRGFRYKWWKEGE